MSYCHKYIVLNRSITTNNRLKNCLEHAGTPSKNVDCDQGHRWIVVIMIVYRSNEVPQYTQQYTQISSTLYRTHISVFIILKIVEDNLSCHVHWCMCHNVCIYEW